MPKSKKEQPVEEAAEGEQPQKAQKGGAKKAAKVAKAVKGSVSRKHKRVRTSVHFFRPKTLKRKRDPKYPKRSVEVRPRMDKYRIIQYPVTTESAEVPQEIRGGSPQDGQVPHHPIP